MEQLLSRCLAQSASFNVRDERGFNRLLERLRDQLGFDYLAFGVRAPLPISRPQMHLFGNYPGGWVSRYIEQNYARVDPYLNLESGDRILWDDARFAACPNLRDEAKEFGLNYGLSLCCKVSNNGIAALSMGRRSEQVTFRETSAIRVELEFLLAYLANYAAELHLAPTVFREYRISSKEREVARWIADGKSSGEIGSILGVSVNTVNFHIKSLNRKLGTRNKASIVACLLSMELM